MNDDECWQDPGPAEEEDEIAHRVTWPTWQHRSQVAAWRVVCWMVSPG